MAEDHPRSTHGQMSDQGKHIKHIMPSYSPIIVHEKCKGQKSEQEGFALSFSS